jgi:glycosyltransferase involved in cell wall biosynthesis
MELALKYSDRLLAALGNYDILHRTYYHPARPSWRRSVCTVVDMTPERMPEYFPWGNPHLAKKEVVQMSDLVLSISECTRRDVLDLYGCSPAKVVTTHLGIDLEGFAHLTDGKGPFAPPYVLFVGNREAYKNFRRFAQAMVAVLSLHRDLSLAIVGGGMLNEEERALFSRAGLSSRVRQADVADVDLPAIYRHAELFVFPSEYEGFGLPLLEAFASRCPVAASKTSCFPEIGGAAIEYFDPKSEDDIAQAIERILGSSTRAEELRSLGWQRAKSFSWERTAEATAAAYLSLR